MKKSLKLGLLLFFSCLTCLGQSLSQEEKEERKANNKLYRGFDFYFSCGAYIGSKANANFYRGVPDPLLSKGGEPDISLVIDNQYYRQDIMELISTNNHGVIAEGFSLDGISLMHYKVSFCFGFGLKYHLSESAAICLAFSQARLQATGQASLGLKSSNTNPDISNIEYFNYPIIGKEVRNFIGFDFTYMFRNEKSIYPFFEFGVHLNTTKVNSCNLFVENVAFDMIDHYGGQSYVPNTTRTEVNPFLGGIGYGFSASLGLRIAFNKWSGLEPVASMSFEKVQLTGYDKIRPNFNFGIRLLLGDRLFSGNLKERNS